MAAATLFGPVVAGALVEKYGWKAMTAAMGVFAFSGAIPAVRSLVMHRGSNTNVWVLVPLHRWMVLRKGSC